MELVEAVLGIVDSLAMVPGMWLFVILGIAVLAVLALLRAK